MAEFVESLGSFKSSISFIEMEPSLDSMSHFGELNHNVMESPSGNLMGFSHDNFLPFFENFSGFSPVESLKPAVSIAPTASDNETLGRGDCKKRKAEAVSEANSGSSSVSPSETKRKNSSRGMKRGRSSSAKADQDKPMEVVHVRARRGQATDSHSLAERVRREKINERMRCLQDLVPGCYKTMGMAGTLDEIINYVQSLQNQVEFLSMKLTAASTFYDFNLDLEATTPQVLPRGEAYQAQEMERLMREGYEGLQQTIFPF